MIENINYFINAIVFVSVIVFLLGFFKILFAKNSESKQEGKKWMAWTAILLIVVVVGVAVLNQVLTPSQPEVIQEIPAAPAS